MIGAIIGDMVGSPYELNTVLEVADPTWTPLFHSTLSKFTDDSVLTVATADAILELADQDEQDGHLDAALVFAKKYKEYAIKYPNRGYGGTFWAWANSDLQVKNTSYADGCMMRCSPIGIAWAHNIESALRAAKSSIEWTHNSPESLRGTSAIVAAICMGIQGKTKQQIKAFVEENYGHWLDCSIQKVREEWDKRNIRCNITCAQSLICFLNSVDYETAIRLAVYSNGDCDTIACIAGSMAEAFYGPQSIPKEYIEEAKKRLPQEMIYLIKKYYFKVCENYPKLPYKNFQI